MRYTKNSLSEEKEPIICHQEYYGDYGLSTSTRKETVDIETALTRAGYGKYNYWLLACMLPASIATLFCTTSISIVLPAAECELQMKGYHVGLLNGAIYAGMVCAGFVWGFLSDTLGRKNLLVTGLFLGGIFEFLSGVVQSYWLLFFTKFLTGCATCGPYALVYTYISEFVGKEHRDSSVMRVGTLTATGYIIQPILAYFVIPRDLAWSLENSKFILTSWRIFLMISSIPSLLGAFIVLFLNETPKFLVSQGRSDEALKILSKIYSTNTGFHPATFSVGKIVKIETQRKIGKSVENIEGIWSLKKLIETGWEQMKPLFHSPYFIPALIVFLAQGMTMLTQTSIRLLLPTIFSAILMNEETNNTVCEMWENKPAKILNCDSLEKINSSVYIYSTIMGCAIFGSFFMSTPLIRRFGKINTFMFCHLVSAACLSVYSWSSNVSGLILASIYVSIMQNVVSVSIAVIVSLVPTSMRVMTVSLVMIFGRIGAIIGNVAMPVMLNNKCFVAFLTIAFVNFCCAPILHFLPKANSRDEDLPAVENDSDTKISKII